MFLLGWTAGEWSAGRSPAGQPRRPPSEWTLRLPCLAPLLLLGWTAPAGQVAGWVAAGAGAVAAGRAEAAARRSVPAAAAADRWSPSRRLQWVAGATVRVTGWPRELPDGWEVPAALVALGDSLGGDASPPPRPSDCVLLRGPGPAPIPGRLLAGVLSACPAEGAATRGGFDRARYFAGRGLLWRGTLENGAAPAGAPDGGGLEAVGSALERVHAWSRAGLYLGMPPREAGLMAGVLLSWRDDALGPTRQPFAELGLSHLFAVSGLHVVILLGVLGALLAPLRPGPVARLAVAGAVLIVYSALTGLSASVLRAAGLASLALAAPVCGRRLDGLRTLGMLFWLNAAWTPFCVLDSGCRLSYLAAGGLVTVHRLVAPPRGWPAAARWVASGLLVTMAAQWFTLPEVMASFGWVHPLSPVANLVVVPAFGICHWLAVLGLAALPLPGGIGAALLAVCWLVLRLLEVGTTLFALAGPGTIGSDPPGPLRLGALLAVSAALLALLASLRRRERVAWRGRAAPPGAGRRRAVAAVAAALATATIVALMPLGRSAPRGAMTAAQLAVGQGDCAALVFPDHTCVLIDTGPGGPIPGIPGPTAMGMAVRPWLRRQGIARVAAVVLTHGHDDHTAGSGDLAAALPVARWWVAGNADAPGEADAPLRGGETIHACPPWRLVCLQAGPAGPTGKDEPSENDRSAVLALLRGERLAALWMGDLETGGEEPLLAALARSGADEPRGVPFLKAGHHGSSTSSGPELLRRLRPGLVSISCGVQNRHRHPSHGPFLAGGDTLTIARTDLDGTLLLRWDDRGGLTWRAARGRGGRLPPPGSLDTPEGGS